MSTIFLSYASEDRARIQPFVAELQNAGLKVLVDYEQIAGGDSIVKGMNEMITLSDGAILFFSEAYLRKPWTSEEQSAVHFRKVENKEYQVVVVRLDAVQIPPLLAHRLWVKDPAPLARAFTSDLRAAVGNNSGMAIPDWLQTFSDDELERMATAIAAVLRDCPSATSVKWCGKRVGALVIYLSQPVVQRLSDALSFALRMLERVDFILKGLRQRINDAGLGIFEGPFMLAERERLRQIEGFRQELKATLDALVEKVVLE